MAKKEWIVEIEQNGGEYTGWVRFFATVVLRGEAANELIVDNRPMVFDEKIKSVSLVG